MMISDLKIRPTITQGPPNKSNGQEGETNQGERYVVSMALRDM